MPAPGVELSLDPPCLDEAETLEAGLRKAQDSLRRLAIADNGSTDGSQDIARANGAQDNDARARLSLTRIGEG